MRMASTHHKLAYACHEYRKRFLQVGCFLSTDLMSQLVSRMCNSAVFVCCFAAKVEASRLPDHAREATYQICHNVHIDTLMKVFLALGTLVLVQQVAAAFSRDGLVRIKNVLPVEVAEAKSWSFGCDPEVQPGDALFRRCAAEFNRSSSKDGVMVIPRSLGMFMATRLG